MKKGLGYGSDYNSSKGGQPGGRNGGGGKKTTQATATEGRGALTQSFLGNDDSVRSANTSNDSVNGVDSSNMTEEVGGATVEQLNEGGECELFCPPRE